MFGSPFSFIHGAARGLILPPPLSGAKFDPAALYPSGEWSLSGDLLTATRVANTQNQAIAYVDTAKTHGHVRFTVNGASGDLGPQGVGVGLSDGTNHATTFLGNGNGTGYHMSGGIYGAGNLVTAAAGWGADGDVIDIDFSDGANAIYSLNGVAQGTVNFAAEGIVGSLFFPAASNNNSHAQTGQSVLFNPVSW